MVEPIAALRSRDARAPRSTAGFTIVETLMAMIVLMIALLSVAMLFERGLSTSRDTRNRVVAAQVASQAIETVRGPAADPAKFTAVVDPLLGQTVSTRTVASTKYTITQDVQWVSQSSNSSLCDAGSSNAAQLLQVSETVTWPNMGGTDPVRSVTTLAPPVGAYSASTGAIAVKVYDSSGAVAPGVNVGISGAASDSQLTTAQGCAFFAYLPVGSYTVTMLDLSGIGDQEVVSPTQSASVILSQITAKSFNFDKPATLTFSGYAITNWPWATAPAAAGNIPVSIGNTGLQPYFQYNYAAGTSTAQVYPYANGYNVFAGNCKDNNPLGKDASNNLLYPTQAPPIVAVEPSTTSASGPIPLYALGVVVKNNLGVVVPNAVLTAKPTTTFNAASPYNAVCTSGGASGTGAVLTMPNTALTGISTAALPLGHWSINVTAPGSLKGCTRLWVKPDGVYNVNTSASASAGSSITPALSAAPTITVTTSGPTC